MVLSLLVVIAIIMVLYFLDMSAIFSPTVGKNTSSKESRPWLEEERILGPEAIIKMPKRPKPAIDEVVSLRGGVTLNDSERGRCELEFNPLGEVSGRWECAYSHEGRDYSFESDFGGNIDVEKIYSDKNGEDESRLYFIAKGEYKKITRRQEQVSDIEEGLIYVTGWLRSDYSANGLITITTDKKWSVAYKFDCK